jgi:hypothetical protein
MNTIIAAELVALNSYRLIVTEERILHQAIKPLDNTHLAPTLEAKAVAEPPPSRLTLPLAGAILSIGYHPKATNGRPVVTVPFQNITKDAKSTEVGEVAKLLLLTEAPCTKMANQFDAVLYWKA